MAHWDIDLRDRAMGFFNLGTGGSLLVRAHRGGCRGDGGGGVARGPGEHLPRASVAVRGDQGGGARRRSTGAEHLGPVAAVDATVSTGPMPGLPSAHPWP